MRSGQVSDISETEGSFVCRADLESRAEQEDYYHYYGSGARYSHYAAGGGGGGGGPRERKRRIAPPPPPGFDDSPPVRKRVAPPPPESFSSGSDGDSGPPVFRNIKVTIKNDSDGTPSLSESEEERRPARKKKRKSEKEKRRRLERKLAKREEELKLLSEQQRPGQARGDKTDQPKKSIKERLGVRKEDLPSVKPSVTTRTRSLPQSSSENTRRDELLRRAEIRRQNQEKSPIPYQGKKGTRTSPRAARSRDRGKTTEGGSKPLDRRRRKRRRRRRDRGRGIKQLSLREETAEMKAKLVDRGGTRVRSGARVEARLARLAGSESPYDSETAGSGSDSETESDDDRPHSQQTRLTGKMRSDEVKVEARAAAGKAGAGDKWKHDKFSEAAGEEEEGEKNFSKHWRGRNRNDRSNNKTGGRVRSTSIRSGSRRRSRSRRTRSRSGRSKSRRKGKKTRRRGKFSRSKSRSSSSSSSRSRSVSRRKSSSSSRSRSRRRSRSGSSDSVIPRSSEDRIKKEGVDLGLSGSLAADTNTVNGSLVKYSEPAEAKKPKKKWRLYVFKVCLTSTDCDDMT